MAIRKFTAGSFSWGFTFESGIWLEVIMKVNLISDEAPQASIGLKASVASGVDLKCGPGSFTAVVIWRIEEAFVDFMFFIDIKVKIAESGAPVMTAEWPLLRCSMT